MKRLAKIIIAIYYQIRYWRKCKLHVFSSTIINNCSFEGKNIIGRSTYLNHTIVGFGSYIGMYGEFTNCTIGKFCSIGNNVRVVSATHPTNMVSTHPAFYSDSYPLSFVEESKFCEHLTTANNNECEIGNDVWIGDNVLLKGGIKVGDGAIIGMGSIVLHDVEPYSIIAGVPAHLIRKRFSDILISELLKTKWWDFPLSWLRTNADIFINPELLLEELKHRVTSV